MWTRSSSSQQQSYSWLETQMIAREALSSNNPASYGTGQLSNWGLECVTPWTCEGVAVQGQVVDHTEFGPLHLSYLHHIKHRHSFRILLAPCVRKAWDTLPLWFIAFLRWVCFTILLMFCCLIWKYTSGQWEHNPFGHQSKAISSLLLASQLGMPQ